MQVAELMTTNLPIISPEATIRKGMQMMSSFHTDTLYVLNEECELLGIVPDFSLLKASLNGTDLDSPVQNILNRAVPTIEFDAKVTEIQHLFREGHNRRMAVLQDGKLVGQIQRIHILGSLLEEEELEEQPVIPELGPNRRIDTSHESRSQPTNAAESAKKSTSLQQ